VIRVTVRVGDDQMQRLRHQAVDDRADREGVSGARLRPGVEQECLLRAKEQVKKWALVIVTLVLPKDKS
jgi:hypothetical protein